MDDKIETIISEITQQLDLPYFRALAEYYEDDEKQRPRCKYLKVRSTLGTAARRAVALGLHQEDRKHILDIGTGIGFFPLVCQHLGHRCETIDVDVKGVYLDITNYLGIAQTIAGIYAGQPFPIKGPFDVISAFAIAFCRHADETLWDASDWAGFIDRALAELVPGGKLALHFNPVYERK